MQRAIFLLLFILVQATAFAADIEKVIPSKIENVTVFLSGAQVTRAGNTQLAAGKTLVIFKNISPYVQKESLQVKGEGKFNVLSVVHQLDDLQEQSKRTDIAGLETQLEKINDRLATEQNLLLVYRTEENMLLKNQEVKGLNASLKVLELKEAVEYHRARLTEVKQKQLASTKTIQELNKQLNKYQQQLQNLNAETELGTSEIVVAVTAKEATSAKFQVSYLVQNASWYPTYDVRVTDITKPINLLSKANVTQQSGENWNEVKLTLSTGDPALTGVKPELQTWNLQTRQPRATFSRPIFNQGGLFSEVSGLVTDNHGQPLPGVTVLVKGTGNGFATDNNGRYSLKLPPQASILVFSFIGFTTREVPIRSSNINITMEADATALNEVVVTGYGVAGALQVRAAGINLSKKLKKEDAETSAPLEVATVQNQTNISFNIAIPYSVPSDGKNYTVEIKEQSIPALYEYYCVPKLDKDAFLTAKIINWEAFDLLEGEASLFFEGTFLGKTILNTNIVSDTLAISLGRDKNIAITRTKLKGENKKQLVGNNRTETLSWEIVARNKKNVPVKLILEDQIPVSFTQEIEVERLASKDADFNPTTGKLTWRLDLPPSQEKKVNFKYSVKYPKHLALALE